MNADKEKVFPSVFIRVHPWFQVVFQVVFQGDTPARMRYF
jgi:hypothetical protein